MMNTTTLLALSHGLDQTAPQYLASLQKLAALTSSQVLLLVPQSKAMQGSIKNSPIPCMPSAALDDYAREPQRLAYAIAKELGTLTPIRAILAPQSAHWLRLLGFLASALELPFYPNLVASELPKFARRICAGKYLERLGPPRGVFCASIDASASNSPPTTERWLGGGAVLKPSENFETILFPKLLDFVVNDASGPKLSTAALIFAGGRGLGTRENFDKLRLCAQKYGAGLGATRHAVDLGWCPDEAQIGQTGQSVAPKRYLAFGISGAIQHWAGIVNAQEIFAVNTDPSAPIFKRAHFGHIGDAIDMIDRLLKL